MSEGTHKVSTVVGSCDWCGYEVRAAVEVRTTVTVTGVVLEQNSPAFYATARIVKVSISHVCYSPKDGGAAEATAESSFEAHPTEPCPVCVKVVELAGYVPDGAPENHDHPAVVPDLSAETPTWATQHDPEESR